MSAPQKIEDVLNGPHIKRLIGDQGFSFVEAEPLRFIPRTQIGKCRECGADRNDPSCSLTRCPQRGARRG